MCKTIPIRAAISCNHFNEEFTTEILLHHHDGFFQDIVFDTDKETGMIDFGENQISLILQNKNEKIEIVTAEFCFKKYKEFVILSVSIPEIQFSIAFPFEFFYLPTRNMYNNNYMLEIGLLSELTDGIV